MPGSGGGKDNETDSDRELIDNKENFPAYMLNILNFLGFDMDNGHKTYKLNSQGNPDKYRAGIFYVGIGGYRIGTNSEELRAVVQNTIHYFDGNTSPYFRIMSNRPATFYWYQGTSTGDTLW